MSDDFSSSHLERAWEPPEEVILRRELVRTPGLQPEDLGVLAELLLRDPRLPSTMEAIRKDLQARGWKMGKDRYNAIAGRLTKAGHLARVSVYDEATQRPTWVTRVFRNPANNQQYVDLGITASMQVSSEVRETRDPELETDPGPRETRVSPGQNRKTGNPRSGSESRETRDLETRVSPGQSRKTGNPRSVVSPPHPPGEEETSSPYPLTEADGSVPSPREAAGVSFAPEDLAAATELLQLLDAPWAVGRVKAKKLAPMLLEVMAEQGWPAIGVVDRQLLMKELTKNPAGVKTSHARILESDRIPNLLRYEVAARRPAGGTPNAVRAGMCERHPAFVEGDCAPCRLAERERVQRGTSEPATVDGAGLLARLRAGLPTD